MYHVNLDQLPPVGFTLEIKHRRSVKYYRLTHAEPYRRALTGDPSYLLYWEDDDGMHYKSGMRGNLRRTSDS